MKQEVCVGGLIQNSNGEFLVVKRSLRDDFMPGMWELPGGGTHFGETPQEALKREVKEEVGLSVIVQQPLGIHTYTLTIQSEDVQRVEITFLCLPKKNKKVVLSHEHSDYTWINQQEVADFTFSEYMHRVVVDSIKNL